MSDEVKLLPCPLCASEQITTAPDREFGAVTWDVICKACGVRVTRDLEEQAIAAWNTRAIEVADDVVERVANMLREAFRAQFDQVYFADHFDRDLFNAGPQEWSEFEGGVKLADRFDLEHIARAAIEATRPPIGTDEVVEREPQEELIYLRGQREYFINAIIEDGELLRDIKEWLKECHDWLMTTDLDMQCPMETDPLDLIDRIDKRHALTLKAKATQ